MYDIISIGGISIDLFFKSDSLTYKDNRFQLAVGGKYVADYFHESIGGGGANVAIGVTKNGLKSAVMGIIGNNPFKRIIREKLEELKVSDKFCQFEDDYYNISTILLTPAGERTIIHYLTPHQSLFKNESMVKNLAEARLIYFGNLSDVSLTQRVRALSFAKSLNILTVMNLGVSDCRRPKHELTDLLKKTDILIVNGHEFSDLVKAPYRDIDFHEDVIKHYFPALSEKIVVVTEGKSGSFAYRLGKYFRQKAVPVSQIVDATGAGDGYSAGFISEYFRSRNIEAAMEKGAKYAAKILSKIGAN